MRPLAICPRWLNSNRLRKPPEDVAQMDSAKAALSCATKVGAPFTVPSRDSRVAAAVFVIAVSPRSRFAAA